MYNPMYTPSGQNKIKEPEIKMTDNVVYGVSENPAPSKKGVNVNLTQNANYLNSIKTTANVCYAPTRQAIQSSDYDYSQYENYDYI